MDTVPAAPVAPELPVPEELNADVKREVRASPPLCAVVIFHAGIVGGNQEDVPED
jgi:hypothetical protein